MTTEPETEVERLHQLAVSHSKTIGRLLVRNTALRTALQDMLDAHPTELVTRDVGKCHICGGITSSGMIHTCPNCAEKEAKAVLWGDK